MSQPLPPQQPDVAPAQGPLKVALLLPLTGPQASIGQALQDAAQLALFDLADDRFELMPRDTKGTPAVAATVARQAIAEGADIIMGPLFGPEVAAVRPVAQNAGIDVLAFTNDWTQAGRGIHVMGFSPASQVDRIVGFASAQGMRRYVALAPQGAYGDAVVNALQSGVVRYGGTARVERYPTTTDLSGAIQQGAAASAGAQALLLAEGGDRARTLAAGLSQQGVYPQQVRFIGTGLWDDTSLGNEPALVGAWYAASDPSARRDFDRRYEQTFGRKAPRIATLAYDATALLSKLSRLYGPAGVTRDTLHMPGGFEGLDGLFRLQPNGVVDRQLAVLEITPVGARVIDPAATSFEFQGQ